MLEQFGGVLQTPKEQWISANLFLRYSIQHLDDVYFLPIKLETATFEDF